MTIREPSDRPIRLVAVIAVAANGVIGAGGGLPFRLSTDLRRYRRLTMGKPMIMGRKTLDSIGRLLDGRDTIVLTRHGSVPFEGALVAGTPEEAIALATERARARGADEIVIAGGAEIFALFAGRLDRLYITHVEAEPEGDARLPVIDWSRWRLVAEEAVPAGPKDSAPSRFAIYDRD